MSAYNKGVQSREEIIRLSREIFNHEGFDLTITKLAGKLNTTPGRITHHFPNKNYLFIAIAEEYQMKLDSLRLESGNVDLNFNLFIHAMSKIMDLQYDYRSSIRYIISSLQNHDEIRSHITASYNISRQAIYDTMEVLVKAGSLKSKILDKPTFEVFQFQLTNLFTTWVINLELYDIDRTYSEMKPIYMKGIVSSFLPYLTRKGVSELKQNGLLA